MGGVFSDLSLAFSPGDFDIIAAVGYTLVFAMDMVVVVAALILNPRARRKRQSSVENPEAQPTNDIRLEGASNT
ncbi:hypothetical protein AAF712_005777 [Marasmius tenuissimus]|uniref:Uncharacterized protein n=1 Tax=Marasmius tenuissimus TaxID=585030 RepID=A0ABR3A1J3_9AGAR